MATISQEKDLEMLKKNSDGTFTKYNPKTKASNVVCNTGKSVESELAHMSTLKLPSQSGIANNNFDWEGQPKRVDIYLDTTIANEPINIATPRRLILEISNLYPYDTSTILQKITYLNPNLGTYERVRVDGVYDTWKKILNQDDYDDLFQSVSNGKTDVSNAITGKGGIVTNTSGTAYPTFSDLVNGINGLSIGRKWASGSFPGTDNSTTPLGQLDFIPSIIAVHGYSGPTFSSEYICLAGGGTTDYHLYMDGTLKPYDGKSLGIYEAYNGSGAYGPTSCITGYNPTITLGNYTWNTYYWIAIE